MADNAQAGAASVTMTAALIPDGKSLSTPNSPTVSHGQMTNYFFLPSGFVAGTGDEATPYQGWGSKKLKE
jgi:hypothetical protein